MSSILKQFITTLIFLILLFTSCTQEMEEDLKDNSIVEMLIHDGDELKNKSKYADAMKIFLRILADDNLNPTDKEKIKIYLRISEMFRIQNVPDSSFPYLSLAESLSVENELDVELSKVFNNKGAAFAAKKEFDSAFIYMDKSLELKKKTKDSSSIATAYNNIGAIQIRRENFAEAEKYMLEGLMIRKAMNDSFAVASSLSNLANIKHRTGKYNEAVNIYKEGLTYCRSSNTQRIEMILYRNLNYAYKKLGIIDSAYTYFVAHAKLKDEIYKENNFAEFAELKEKYETEKKDQQILLQKSELEANRIGMYWLGSALVFVIIIAVLVGYNYNQKRKTNILLHEQKQTIIAANKSLEDANRTKDKLFSIIAHDLRSPIASLQTTLNKHKNEVKEQLSTTGKLYPIVKTSIDSLFVLTENLLNWAMAQRDKIPFNPSEFDIAEMVEATIESYSEQANSKNISLSTEHSQEFLIWADINMIQSVLNNLLTNAIKFTKTGGEISISFAGNQEQVTISVKDSGIGLSPEKIEILLTNENTVTTRGTNNEKGSGLGLKICQEFLKINNSKLDIRSTPDKGSSFSFSLPKPDEGMVS